MPRRHRQGLLLRFMEREASSVNRKSPKIIGKIPVWPDIILPAACQTRPEGEIGPDQQFIAFPPGFRAPAPDCENAEPPKAGTRQPPLQAYTRDRAAIAGVRRDIHTRNPRWRISTISALPACADLSCWRHCVTILVGCGSVLWGDTKNPFYGNFPIRERSSQHLRFLL